jgi:hypothetical protein
MEGSATLSFADIDRDGWTEVYTYARSVTPDGSGNHFGHFVIYRDARGPAASAPSVLTHRVFRFRRPANIAIGDVDGDSRQELVAGTYGVGCLAPTCGYTNYYVRRAVLVAHADGTFLPKFPKPVPQFVPDEEDPFTITVSFGLDDDRQATPAIADLDGDGLKEVLWVDPEGPRLFVWNVAGTPGPLVADWPVYHHDARHSNAFVPTP